MSDHTEGLFKRLEAIIPDVYLTEPEKREIKALLWEINSDSWERGVMWKGGIGTIRPERPANPYLTGADA